MSWTDHALIFSPAFRACIGSSSIGLVDCGARGNIPEPWLSYEKQWPGAVQVLGFEADPAEAARLNATHPTCRKYVAAAAWNSAGTQTLHITKPPQASSLFPPSDHLENLYTLIGTQYHNVVKSRPVVQTVDVATTTIDAEISGFDGDVLKIDTQGAEYEILEGAESALSTHVFAVVAETWTAETYKGVKPAWDVMRLMHGNGYTLMTSEIAGLGRRSFSDTPTFKFVQREQIISPELLFFRNTKTFVRAAADATKAFKAVGIADVFGFPDVSVELLQEIVMRWPAEIHNVQRCYDELLKRRANNGQPLDALYPKLHG